MAKTITIHKEEGDEPKTPVVLLKFGQLEHLQKLLINGELYVSSIEELRRGKGVDDGEENYRNDAAEGAHFYVSTGLATATFDILKNPDGTPLSIPIVNANYYKTNEITLGNISSFYGITTDCFVNNELMPIDARMKKFGEHFIVIKNFDAFVSRIDAAIEKTSQTSWAYSFVKYFDENTYHGPISLHKKRSRFAFQKEFRMDFKTEDVIPIIINIGNIEDIAFILSSEVVEHLQMTIDLSKKESNMRWPIFEKIL